MIISPARVSVSRPRSSFLVSVVIYLVVFAQGGGTTAALPFLLLVPPGALYFGGMSSVRWCVCGNLFHATTTFGGGTPAALLPLLIIQLPQFPPNMTG